MPKGSLLPTANTVGANDYIFIVSSPATLAETNKITANNFFANVAALVANSFIITNNTTPSNSTMTVTKGKIFYDTDYLYIAVANNNIKRISLVSF